LKVKSGMLEDNLARRLWTGADHKPSWDKACRWILWQHKEQKKAKNAIMEDSTEIMETSLQRSV